VRGVGHASGAVTIVNALPTGVGCAVAISLPVRTELDLHSTEGLSSHRIQIEHAADTPLVRETVSLGLARFAPGKMFSGEVRIDSKVPVGKGLKSSSAVGASVLAAIANALRQSRPPAEFARLAADVAQEIGLSATGAFDDCLASARGGLALTDNLRRATLRTAPFDMTLHVALYIPTLMHSPSPQWLERFRAEAKSGRTAAEAARTGKWADAMSLNTELVERVMGYEYHSLRTELVQRGAVMCGVSGLGPTLAALAPPAQIEAVAEALPRDGGEVRLAQIRPSMLGAGDFA
jgi:shikimate kinase